MEQRTITVYTAAELQADHPKAFDRAHRGFLEDCWDLYASDHVGYTMVSVADDRGWQTERGISYDLYRQWVRYEDGPLTAAEAEQLAALGYNLGDTRPVIDEGMIECPNAWDDPPGLEAAQAWLAELYGAMLEEATEVASAMEAPETFLAQSEESGWMYDQYGRMF